MAPYGVPGRVLVGSLQRLDDFLEQVPLECVDHRLGRPLVPAPGLPSVVHALAFVVRYCLYGMLFLYW